MPDDTNWVSSAYTAVMVGRSTNVVGMPTTRTPKEYAMEAVAPDVHLSVSISRLSNYPVGVPVVGSFGFLGQSL